MKLLRSNGYCALPLLLLLSSPAWAASYSENMQLGEYIVGLAALVLVVWDIARRYLQRPEGEARPASSSIASVAGTVKQLSDARIWAQVREVVLDHPFESSALLCSFALLTFARVPFSLSAALVGTVTYLSLVLGARLASCSGAKPAAARPAAQPVAAAKPAIVARPAPQATTAAKPAPRRPAPAAKPEAPKPEVADAAASPPTAPDETPAEVAAAPAEAPAPKTEAKAAPAPRRRSGGSAAGAAASPKPASRRRPTKPKAS